MSVARLDTGITMPEVTVVIATRNRRASLERTLHALHAHPAPPAVIVVDNCSADGTPDMVAGSFPQARVLTLGRNAGAVARNHGVAAATTPYVAFADDDSWWAPGALTRAARHLDDAPRLALIAARTLVGPAERLDPMSAFMVQAPLGVADDLPGPSVLGFLACAAVVRREPFLACGGFDPVVFFMGEEARVALDLRTGGHGLAYCNDVVAYHHPSPDVGEGTAKRLLALRNGVLTAWMRRPARVAVAETARLLRAAGADPAARRAAVQLLQRLPGALVRRNPVPADVERELRTLAAMEAAAGYSTAPH
ncbi:glycosyltransferase family 2 protein [Dactylosporangium matsuzakiense]|uniref:glycosyltransferase family 2 protein n=1 Tax=Dactylosporangium matsuzakiense TaxID=53360 RepID=UPI0022F2B7E8|nr:glycosyltransferase family 2 protein [Dactylosporangium matsuzakiense]